MLTKMTRRNDELVKDVGIEFDPDDFNELALTNTKTSLETGKTTEAVGGSKSSGTVLENAKSPEMHKSTGGPPKPGDKKNKKKGETSKPSETLKSKAAPVSAPTTVSCYACVLWHPAIKAEMELHRSVGNSLYSTLGIGRLISDRDKIIMENPNMDWKKPFLLLDVIYREGITALKDTDGSYKIPVEEKDTADNKDVSAAKRVWDLHVSSYLSPLAVEILRGPPTTIMIWGARKCPADASSAEEMEPQHRPEGEIYIDLIYGPINILIFHSEDISKERVMAMKGDFGRSELGAFNQGYRRRICHSMVDGTVAVHFSRWTEANYSCVPGKQEVIPIPPPPME
ncbi:unnamed protein product [Orchesella dallaii]|uniref:Uncharacterized protein n=1 Tax=Orchesella dallaii TaxID=48710 RepID=A0ABP1RSB4_9HEXA